MVSTRGTCTILVLQVLGESFMNLIKRDATMKVDKISS